MVYMLGIDRLSVCSDYLMSQIKEKEMYSQQVNDQTVHL